MALSFTARSLTRPVGDWAAKPIGALIGTCPEAPLQPLRRRFFGGCSFAAHVILLPLFRARSDLRSSRLHFPLLILGAGSGAGPQKRRMFIARYWLLAADSWLHAQLFKSLPWLWNFLLLAFLVAWRMAHAARLQLGGQSARDVRARLGRCY